MKRLTVLCLVCLIVTLVGAGTLAANRTPVYVAGWSETPDLAAKRLNERLTKMFEDKYPDLTIEGAPLPAAGGVESGAVGTLIRSGVPLDVLNVNAGPGRIGLLAKNGLIVNMEKYYEMYKWDQRITPGAMELLKRQLNGQLWEFPNGVDVITVYYNQDVFDKVGIGVPVTPDEMIANMEKLKSAGYLPLIVGTRASYFGGWIFGNLIQSTASEDAFADILYGDGKWNAPYVVKAAELLADWAKKGYIPPESNALGDQEAYNLFITKRAAMVITGQWFNDTLVRNEADVNTVNSFVMPAFTERGKSAPTGGLANSWVIAASSKNPDNAAKFIDFYMSMEVLKIRAEEPTNGIIFPVNMPADTQYGSPIMKKAFADVTKGAGYNPSVFIPSKVKDVYYQSIQGLIGGFITPEKAMNDIQKAWELAKQAGDI